MIKLLVFMAVWSIPGGTNITTQEEWFETHEQCYRAGEQIQQSLKHWSPMPLKVSYTCFKAKRWKNG